MSNTPTTQQTYTKDEVITLMHHALHMWDTDLMKNITALENNPEFQAEAKADNYTPANYLYYAQDDTSIYHPDTIRLVLEEYHSEELKQKAKEAFDHYKVTKEIPSAEELLLMLRHHNRGDK